MTEPGYQPEGPTTTQTAAGGGAAASAAFETQGTSVTAPHAASGDESVRPAATRGLLVAAWVAAVALAVLALVAVVWTIELIRIQLELQEAARSVRDYVARLGGVFGSGGTTPCPNGEPAC